MISSGLRYFALTRLDSASLKNHLIENHILKFVQSGVLIEGGL